MPVYLLHGFRWPRPLIRIHIILQNLDDAAAEWLVAQGTTQTMRKNFNELYPDAMKHLTRLRFIEQYDPNDLSPTAASQPYAYVADIVEEVELGVDIDEVRGRGVGNDQWSALQDLRDKIAPEEKVGWYVVVCGDEERWAPPTMSLLRESGHNGVRHESDADSCCHSNKQGSEDKDITPEPEPKGFRKFFGSSKLRGRRSRANSTHNRSPSRSEKAPPLPSSSYGLKAPQLPHPSL